MKGENRDKGKQLLHITGKGGRYRAVPVPENILSQLNNSRQYLFTLSAYWRAGFRRVIGEATKALAIEISGVHRLQANYAQEKYQIFLSDDLPNQEARRRVSELLGHARIDVTYKYVPKLKLIVLFDMQFFVAKYLRLPYINSSVIYYFS